jgi:hypothetical protein
VFLPDTHVTRFVSPVVFSSKKINFKHGNSAVMVEIYGCIINKKRKTVFQLEVQMRYSQCMHNMFHWP